MSDLTRPTTPEGVRLLDVLARHSPRVAEVADEHDARGTFPIEVVKELAADGVLGATVPARLGGMGLSSVHDLCLAVARLAEVDASLALSLHMQWCRGITMTYETEHSDDTGRALAERILRLMASGEALVSGALKDAGKPTELTPAPGGWRMSGGKILVSMAPVASHFVVAARALPESGRPREASVFLPAGSEGLTVTGTWDGLGMRASASTALRFDGCRIPDADLFLRGPVGERDDAALAGQTVSSIGLLGVYAGLARSARDITVAGLVRRGGPHPAAVRTMVAEIDVKLYSLSTALGAALANTERYAHRTLDDPAERGRRMMTAFQQAKLIVNRCASAIVEDCMTLMGGASFVSVHPLARRYRDVRAGWFMQPFTYADAVDRLSAWALEPGE